MAPVVKQLSIGGAFYLAGFTVRHSHSFSSLLILKMIFYSQSEMNSAVKEEEEQVFKSPPRRVLERLICTLTKTPYCSETV